MRKTGHRLLLVLVLLVGSVSLAAVLFRSTVREVLFAEQFEDY